MPKPDDYSNWLTKQQAAEAIGIATKTIEQLAREGQLQQAKWRRPDGGPRISVYHPKDVERLRKERNPDAAPFVLPASADLEVRAAQILQRMAEGSYEPLPLSTSQNSQNSEKSLELRLSEKLYLTTQEAVVYTGLGVGYLRRLVENGTLSPLKGAGPRGASVFRRADLEKL